MVCGASNKSDIGHDRGCCGTRGSCNDRCGTLCGCPGMASRTQPVSGDRLMRRFISLLASLLVLSIIGCRTSNPPKIEICIGDGVGGADCIERDGSKLYRVPSQLLNYWMTNQIDETAFSSWCYDTSLQTTESISKTIAREARTASIRAPETP